MRETSRFSLTCLHVCVHHSAYLGILAGGERPAGASSEQLQLFELQVAIAGRV